MVTPKTFAFMGYGTSDKKGYPHFLSFRAIENEETYRLYTHISDTFAIELSYCAFRSPYDQSPYKVERFQNKDAYQCLQPILQRERLRITVEGFPIKKLMDHYK